MGWLGGGHITLNVIAFKLSGQLSRLGSVEIEACGVLFTEQTAENALTAAVVYGTSNTTHAYTLTFHTWETLACHQELTAALAEVGSSITHNRMLQQVWCLAAEGWIMI